MILQPASGVPFSTKPWGFTGTENRGSKVALYSETPELGGTNDNAKLKSISAMPQYIDRSHEELRVEDYELLKVKASNFSCEHRGNAFQQSSSLFGPHISPVPSSQSSTGGALSSSPTSSELGISSGSRTSTFEFPNVPFTPSTTPSFGTLSWSNLSSGDSFSSVTSNNPVSTTGGALSSSPTSSVLGTSSGSRTSTFEFPNVPPSEGPSVSPFTASTTPSFGTLPWSNLSSGHSFSSGTSNNPVSTTSGFSFDSSSAFGNSNIFGIQATSESPGKTATKHQGSRVPYYSATAQVEIAHNIEYITKLQSISAMPSYNDKSHEELRLEGYGLSDKGGQVRWGIPFHAPPSPFPFPPTSIQSSVSPFQPVKSSFSELERGKSVTPSNTMSTVPAISPFVNPFSFLTSSNQSSVSSFQPLKSTISAPVISPFVNPFSFPPSSNQSSVSSFQPLKSTISAPVISPFVNPLPFPSLSNQSSVSPFQPFKSTFSAPVISPNPLPFPPLSSQSFVSPFQPFKSTFSELERDNSVTPSSTVSTSPTISPFGNSSCSNDVNRVPQSQASTLQPATASFGPTVTLNWNPPSIIPRTEPVHPNIFEFPKTFPCSSVETFSLSKPSVIFSPFVQSTPVTSSDSLPSIVAPSQPQQTAEKVRSFPFSDPNQSSQGFSVLTKPWSAAGAECPRSMVASYSETPEYEGPGSAKLKSISAMPHYKDRSHEELRLEDYELLKVLQGTTVTKYQGSRVAPYSATAETEFDMTCSIGFISNIHSISALPSYNDKSHEELRLGDYGIGDKGGATLWGSPLFRSIILEKSDTPNIFRFPPLSNQSSVLSPQPFKSAFSERERENCTTSSITISTTSPLSLSAYPPQSQASALQHATFSSVETFSFTKSPSLESTPVTSSHPCSFTVSKSQPEQAAERLGSLPSDNLLKPSPASSGLASVTEVTSQNDNEQYAPPSNMVMKSPLVANPFAMRLPIDQPNAVTSRLHGISSLPVSDNQSLSRRESLLRIRHVSSRLPGLPARKPNGGSSGTKVPFFIDEEDKLGPVAPTLPREKSRAWVNVSSLSLHSPEDSKDDKVQESSSSIQPNEGSTRLTEVTATQHEDKVSAPTERYVADVLALLPKLSAADYYIEPSLSELAAKELAEAGFCSHVKDFIVGRKGYGSIKFLGETDIRNLDIESIVEFKDREVTVYPDEEKKPQVGQHLNKEAEVTLLNVKCIDSKTGKQYVEGHQVQSYQEMLIKKIEEQGAEFVSYDPVEGEWKVRVQHF